jgi:recombination protein RecR
MHSTIEKLNKIFSSLPSLGPRSARRICLTLVKNQETLTKELIKTLVALSSIKECDLCNNFSEKKICDICSDLSRDHDQICIVEDILSLWAIERTGQYNGLFYVLNEETSLSNSTQEKLIKSIENKESHMEIIIAMNSTIEGQALATYIKSILRSFENITLTTLALGIPMGSQMDYIDQGTLTIAFKTRKEFS